MKKAFRWISICAALLMLVCVMAPAALAADKPDDATPVVDFTYLPEGQELTLANDIGGFMGIQMVTSKDLVVSKVKEGGKEWLLYHRNNKNWNGGIYLDLIRAKAKKKAVTDWTGGTTLWFYIKAAGDAYLNVVLATDNEDSGDVQGFFDSEVAGVKYLLEENGAFVEKTTTEDTWKHMFIASGYEGWVGFDLSQMNCRSSHLKSQRIADHLNAIYGVGLYMEGTDVYIRDIRVSGVKAKIGAADPTTAPPPATKPPTAPPADSSATAAPPPSSDATTADLSSAVDRTTAAGVSSGLASDPDDGEEKAGLPVALIVLLCVLGAGAVAVVVIFLIKRSKGGTPPSGTPDADGRDV